MRRSQILAWLVFLLPASAYAQWSAHLDVGAMVFGGASHDTSGITPPADFRPSHATAVQLGLERRWSSLGIALAIAHASPGIAIESDQTLFVQKDFLDFWEIAPEASARLAGRPGGIALRGQLGPLFDFWQPSGGSSQARVGVQTGVSLEWPLSARLTGSARAAFALSSSPFEAGVLPDRFALRPMWRRTIAGAVRWRL